MLILAAPAFAAELTGTCLDNFLILFLTAAAAESEEMSERSVEAPEGAAEGSAASCSLRTLVKSLSLLDLLSSAVAVSFLRKSGSLFDLCNLLAAALASKSSFMEGYKLSNLAKSLFTCRFFSLHIVSFIFI